MPPAPRHSLLFLSCKAPWASGAAGACADVMMTAAVFDQDVGLVFCGDGVYQLLANQDGSAIDHKTLANIFPALELYDIHRVYAEAAALRLRGLAREDLLIDVQEIGAEELQSLLAESRTVMVF